MDIELNAADKARFGGPTPSVSATELARLASKAEREANHIATEYEIAAAEYVLFGEERAPAATPQAQAALTAARAGRPLVGPGRAQAGLPRRRPRFRVQEGSGTGACPPRASLRNAGTRATA